MARNACYDVCHTRLNLPSPDVSSRWQQYLRWLSSEMHEQWLFLIIIVLGVAVRTWRFGEVPPGLNQDEATTAYDAYSLLQYGIDRHGFGFPVIFLAWGGGPMDALRGYLSLPFLWALGPTVIAARMATMMINVAAIPLVASLAGKIRGRSASLIAAFLVAVNPWHIVASRWAHEHSVLAVVALFGTWLIASSEGRPRRFFAACAVFALALYAYAPALIVIPVYLALAVAALLVRRRISLGEAALGLAAFGIVAAPLGMFFLVNRFGLEPINWPIFSIPVLHGPSHYESASSLFSDDPLSAVWPNIEELFRMLIYQQDGLIWNAVPGFGIFYLWAGAFSLVGVVILIFDARRSLPSQLTIFWFIAALVLCSVLPPNINRFSILMPPLILAAAIAIDVLGKDRLVLAGIVTTYLVSFGLFTHTYFTSYSQEVGREFYASFGEAIQFASANTQGTICVTSQVRMPYIHVLYFAQVPPYEFVGTVQYENPGEEIERVSYVGRYIFGVERCAWESPQAYVVHNSEEWAIDVSRFTLVPYGDYIAAIAIEPLQTPVEQIAP